MTSFKSAVLIKHLNCISQVWVLMYRLSTACLQMCRSSRCVAFHFSVCMIVKCSHRPYKCRSSWPVASSSYVADVVGTLFISSSPQLLRTYLPNLESQYPPLFVREPTLPSAWQAKSSGELTSPGSRPQAMTDGSWHRNYPAPSPWVGLLMGECVLNWFPELPQWVVLQLPTALVCLITYPLRLLPLCLTALHPFWLPFNSQINYLYLISYFKVCFWGNPN